MKKFCNKISTQQWRVTVPNLNANIFRKSAEMPPDSTGSVERKRISAGSYDLPAAQREYDMRGAISHNSLNSASSSTGSYQDAQQEENPAELYDIVDVHHSIRIVESKNLTESNNRYEYDVPKIHFCFIEEQAAREKEALAKNTIEEIKEDQKVDDANSNYENTNKTADKLKTKMTHRSQLQITMTNVIDIGDNGHPSPVEVGHHHMINLNGHVYGQQSHPVIKFGSDPNLNHAHCRGTNDDGDRAGSSIYGEDQFYKVPRRMMSSAGSNRLSKSLHDFNADDFNLPQLSLSEDESIEHISCSQVLPTMHNQNQNSNLNVQDKSKSKRRLRASRQWNNFKSKFNRTMQSHANAQRVGAFGDRDKLSLDLEGMCKSSMNKCKKIFRNTGRIMFNKGRKPIEGEVDCGDNSSQIVKNDAFFAKIKASDIEYVLPKRNNITEVIDSNGQDEEGSDKCGTVIGDEVGTGSDTVKEGNSEDREKSKSAIREYDQKALELCYRKRISGAIAEEVMLVRNGFRKSRHQLEGQNGFDDLRRYVKQGGDFCKELAAILQERSEAELQYSKSLSKLSGKLSRACREGVGGLNEAWKAVAIELETRAEAHRHMSNVLQEETAKPLKILSENQHRQRKNSEGIVDKAAKVLSEWRAAEAKSKKHSHACARDNEKLQDAMLENRMSRSTSLIQLPNINKNNTDKDSAKLEGKKRKAEDAVKKADIEYYSHCVRSERARLEWESAVLKGASSFQTLEEERLNNLKSTLSCYLKHNSDLSPKLEDAVTKIRTPIESSEAQKDLSTFVSLRQSSQQTSEQLLPDFYCEHITLAMNRERRKQALVKLLQLIKLDIEREKKSKDGLETLSKAIKQTPNFGSEESQQTVVEKLYHMKSMLTYLEGAKYKVQSALAELDCRPRTGHPLASHITITRDKAGLQQSILKAPLWLREQWAEADEQNKIDKIDSKEGEYDVENNWIDRGMADGNSNQHDSDFDEFSSQGSSICGGNCPNEEIPVQPIAQCKALYMYTPNLPDELAIRPGDKVVVYRQQEDGWWLGECNGNVGIFPATYVETMKT